VAGLCVQLTLCLRHEGYTVVVVRAHPTNSKSAPTGGPSEIIVLDPARADLDGFDLRHRLADAGLATAIALIARQSGRQRGRAGRDHPERFRVDEAGRRIFIDQSELRLSPKERDLLTYLLRRPGVAVTRTQLLHDVWSRDGPHAAKTVDVHIRWLRQRLAEYEPVGLRIVTVRGTGYRLDLTPELSL